MTTDSTGSVVAVTGAAGYIGFRLLQELEGAPFLEYVVAIDQVPLPRPLHNTRSYRMEMSQPLRQPLSENHVNTVVHLAFQLREGANQREAEEIRRENVDGLNNLLKACSDSNVSSLIYLSSHTVYGAHGDNPMPVTEEAPPRPLAGFQYGETKDECERILLRFAAANPKKSVTILRCCMVMGPEGGNRVTEGFDKPFLLRVAGYDPPIQLIHTADLAKIIATLCASPTSGVFNLAGKGAIPYSRLARVLGKRALALPSIIAYPLVNLSWKLGLQREADAIGLNFIRYPIVMATGKIRKTTGYSFRYSAIETARAYASANAK